MVQKVNQHISVEWTSYLRNPAVKIWSNLIMITAPRLPSAFQMLDTGMDWYQNLKRMNCI